MAIYKVEVIYTFNIMRQCRIRFEVDSETITDEYFYEFILRELTKEELYDLCKMSMCQECDNEAEIIPFIDVCKGKIFLNDPNDPIREKILDIRDKLIENENYLQD